MTKIKKTELLKDAQWEYDRAKRIWEHYESVRGTGQECRDFDVIYQSKCEAYYESRGRLRGLKEGMGL